jgi:hypothetical protein
LGFPIARIIGLISLSVGSVVSYSMGPLAQGKGSGETSLIELLINHSKTKELNLQSLLTKPNTLSCLLFELGISMVFPTDCHA